MKIKPIAPNQTEVHLRPGLVVLHSYSTPVAACMDGAFYRTDKKYSVTTSKHINAWLGGVIADMKPQSWFDELGGVEDQQ